MNRSVWLLVCCMSLLLSSAQAQDAQPPGPPAPTRLHAFALNGKVALNWDQMQLVDSYRIYRSASATPPTNPLISGILPISGATGMRQLEALDANAANGTSWHYWVSSVTAGGETRTSVGVVATPSEPTSSAITVKRPLRILALGDSITQGYPINGGYRLKLVKNLTAGGYRATMVGSRRDNSDDMGDTFHEGWPGWSIDSLKNDAAERALTTYQPDIILLMIGTNCFVNDRNIFNQVTVDKALVAYDELMAKILLLAPKCRVIVASIIPIKDSTMPAAFNAALKTRITALGAQHRPVTWCDMSSITVGQLADPFHPNAQGYAAMGDIWYKAIQALTVKGP